MGSAAAAAAASTSVPIAPATRRAAASAFARGAADVVTIPLAEAPAHERLEAVDQAAVERRDRLQVEAQGPGHDAEPRGLEALGPQLEARGPGIVDALAVPGGRAGVLTLGVGQLLAHLAQQRGQLAAYQQDLARAVHQLGAGDEESGELLAHVAGAGEQREARKIGPGGARILTVTEAGGLVRSCAYKELGRPRCQGAGSGRARRAPGARVVAEPARAVSPRRGPL